MNHTTNHNSQHFTCSTSKYAQFFSVYLIQSIMTDNLFKTIFWITAPVVLCFNLQNYPTFSAFPPYLDVLNKLNCSYLCGNKDEVFWPLPYDPVAESCPGNIIEPQSCPWVPEPLLADGEEFCVGRSWVSVSEYIRMRMTSVKIFWKPFCFCHKISQNKPRALVLLGRASLCLHFRARNSNSPNYGVFFEICLVGFRALSMQK